MTNEKLEVAQAELCSIHHSIEKLVGALNSATRKCERGEDHKLRVEIKANQGKVADLQKLRCQLAQEQVAARYVEIQEELEQERATREEMALQESSVTGQLASIGEKIRAFDRAPSWQLSRLTQQAKRTVPGPLRRALEVKLAAEEQAHQAALNQASELESQLHAIRNEVSQSDTREANLKVELEKILAVGQSHYRMVAGSLEEICAALRDPRLTVDRWAAEELLRNWQKGFQETLGLSGAYGDEMRTLTFQVESAGILYWNDTGEIADSLIFSAKAGTEIWPKSVSTGNLPLKLTQEALEEKRAAMGTQAVAV